MALETLVLIQKARTLVHVINRDTTVSGRRRTVLVRAYHINDMHCVVSVPYTSKNHS